mgnify:CR=1 FL=1
MVGYYMVDVINRETGELVRQVNAGESRSRAGRIQGGLEINLNHNLYYTKIRFVDMGSVK